MCGRRGLALGCACTFTRPDGVREEEGGGGGGGGRGGAYGAIVTNLMSLYFNLAIV